MLKGFRIVLAIAWVCIALVSCREGDTKTTPSATFSKRFHLVGTVISVDEAQKEAIVDHDAIDDFMDAMRMGFSVPNDADLAKLSQGAKINATLVVENGMMWIEGVTVVGRTELLQSPARELAKERRP